MIDLINALKLTSDLYRSVIAAASVASLRKIKEYCREFTEEEQQEQTTKINK